MPGPGEEVVDDAYLAVEAALLASKGLFDKLGDEAE